MTDRLNAEALLAAVQREEARRQRGRLKIFLGMCAGVGKTYAMLQEARQLLQEGVDVVVGYVESHGRADTDALLAGLPQIPCLALEHKAAQLREPDLDGILARRPQLVLLDELAHSNAPGSRHAKRYQDVQEVLEAGIDVYTTVNIQHLESRADTVQQITGIVVHERVPDGVLDLADDIVLIDLSPEALLARLAEGKVYLGERASLAAQHFFQRGHLTALRELALRMTAERVDRDLKDYLSQHRAKQPWRANERLMVAVSPSPSSSELIRWARRMAYNLGSPWLAVYVDTGQTLTGADQQRLNQHLELARELGADVLHTHGNKLQESLLQIARQEHVGQIILGKPQQTFWQDLWRGNIWRLYRFIRQAGPIDIWVVDSTQGHLQRAAKPLPPLHSHQSTHHQARDYAWALGGMLGLTLLNHGISPFLGYWSIALIFLLGVSAAAIYLRQSAALLAAGLSAILWNFFFIPPLYTFYIAAFHDALMCLVYFWVALIVAGLMSRIRQQEHRGRQREARMHLLYRFSRELSGAADNSTAIRAACRLLTAWLQAEVSFISDHAESLKWTDLPEKEGGVARWAFNHRQAAGTQTQTLPSAKGYYLPVATQEKVYGVLGIYPAPQQVLSFEIRTLLDTLSQQLALRLEREALQQIATEQQVDQISSTLYETLLNSVSHELRTPLTTIQGAVQNLQDPVIAQQPILRSALLQDLHLASQRLDHLVANLLDMSRLQSGRLELNLDWCDPGDIVRAALAPLQNLLKDYAFEVYLPPVLKPIQGDFGLLEQVFSNLIHNAMMHNAPGTRIRMEVYQGREDWGVRLRDFGQGIPEAALPQLFEKFYRAPNAPTGGTGLGLSICAGIVTAHGGSIVADNHLDGGAIFTVLLPYQATPELFEEGSHDSQDSDC